MIREWHHDEIQENVNNKEDAFQRATGPEESNTQGNEILARHIDPSWERQ